MEIKMVEQSVPVKFTITEKAEVIDEKKKEIYEKIKNTIKIDGFRAGTVPQEVAEQKMDLFTAYKEIIDNIFYDVQKQYGIVSFKDFKIFGNTFKKGKDLKCEFIGELKPKIKQLAHLGSLELKYEKDLKVEAGDLDQAIDLALKEREVLTEAGKEVLENSDIAIIDFTGYLENHKEPFKGGSAKNFQVCVNKEENGRKNFIDNFEDQMVGMKVNETRTVNVKFPDDYRDKSKAGKKARFEVKLISIKKIIRPTLDEEFAKSKGFESIDAFKKELEKNILVSKRASFDNGFKRDIINKVVEATEITPIPQGMFENELEKEWDNFLSRMGKTEKEYLKDNQYGKDHFKINNESTVRETIKVSLVLEEVFKVQKLEISKEETKQYLVNMIETFRYSVDKKTRLLKDFEENEQHFETMKKAAMNEKTVNYLFEYFKNK